MSNAPPPKGKSKKINVELQTNSEQKYNLTVFNKEEDLTFTLENQNDFPMKIFELKISMRELKDLDENFFVFKNAERLINGIENFIKTKKYSVNYDERENCMIFEIKNELFENGIAKIKIPEKEKDLETKVECLTKMVTQLQQELKNYKINKEEAAIKSFEGTAFLNDEEKKLISQWIHPNKAIKFKILFSSSIDGDSCSTFHYYCDGIFPTVTVVLDTSGRRFGGYSTQSWGQSSVGANNGRAPGSFIFNLSNKQKYDLIDEVKSNAQKAVFRHNSYGPIFGGGHDLCIVNSSNNSTSNYCNKNDNSAYNTGNNNLLGGNGQTFFQVKYYEVYQVVFE